MTFSTQGPRRFDFPIPGSRSSAPFLSEEKSRDRSRFRLLPTRYSVFSAAVAREWNGRPRTGLFYFCWNSSSSWSQPRNFGKKVAETSKSGFEFYMCFYSISINFMNNKNNKFVCVIITFYNSWDKFDLKVVEFGQIYI